jgi:hypothetical protein
MTAWLGETRLARSGACLTVDEQAWPTRGQVLTADGRLLASFRQDAMIRGLGDSAALVLPGCGCEIRGT